MLARALSVGQPSPDKAWPISESLARPCKLSSTPHKPRLSCSPYVRMASMKALESNCTVFKQP